METARCNTGTRRELLPRGPIVPRLHAADGSVSAQLVVLTADDLVDRGLDETGSGGHGERAGIALSVASTGQTVRQLPDYTTLGVAFSEKLVDCPGL